MFVPAWVMCKSKVLFSWQSHAFGIISLTNMGQRRASKPPAFINKNVGSNGTSNNLDIQLGTLNKQRFSHKDK